MNYQPLGTRAFDHFILEYQQQARQRGWQVAFGFTAPPPASMDVRFFLYDPRSPSIETCDVLQTSFHSAFDPPILKLKSLGRVKKLAIIDHSSGSGPSADWKTPLRRWRGRRVGRIVDAIICVSHHNARRAVERVFLPPPRVHVVHNGIDISRFPFQPQDAAEINYVGQLIPEKGVLTLLDALRRMPVSWPCRIAGSGPLRETLESHAAGLPVTFLGHVADVRQCYRGIVVVPSTWAEAFGLVAIEAMACGAALVVSDAGALPEVVGDAAVSFHKGDAAELSERLKQLMADAATRARLSQAGRQRVEEHFQLSDCVRRHLDIIDSLS